MVSTNLSSFGSSIGRADLMQAAFNGCAEANQAVPKIFTMAARGAVRWLLILACFTLVPSAYAGVSPQSNEVHLQLRWHHQFQFAGYYAALEKGFYKDEGLNVHIHAGDPTHQPVPEVLAGRAQYAEGNSEVLYQRLQGKPLVALAAIFQHSPSVLLTRRSSHIHTLHQLVGKTVMLMNKNEDADFLAMFLSEGIPLSKVNILSSSYDIEDLISGRVDAFNSYSTNEPYYLNKREISYEVIAPSAYRIDFYSDILFTSESELEKHPKRVEAMRRASLKGWRYAMDNPEEIIDLLINKYHVEKTRDHLRFEAAEMRKLIFPDLIEIGHMNPGRWKHMADSFVKAGLAEPGYSLDDFIYDTTPKPMPDWVAPAFSGILLILLSISSVAVYLIRLNKRIAMTKQSLAQSEERLRLALGTAKQAWFDLDLVTGEVTVSPEYPKILGFDPDTFRSSLEEWQNNVHPDDRAAVLAAFDQCLINGGPVSMSYRRKNGYGEWRWLQSTGQIIKWGDQHQPLRMVGINADISERKCFERKLEEQAHIDYLTGLANRRYFSELAEAELQRSVRYGRAMSLLILDIDHFKAINDNFGHKVGDEILQRLAAVCRNTLREVDVIGRWGGEEFAILLPETDEDRSVEVAERLRYALSAEKFSPVDEPHLGFTVSIGCVTRTAQHGDLDALFIQADRALYTAKNSGRNKVVVADCQ